MSNPTLGQLVHSFFVDHLQIVKGLRPSSVSSYRDGVRLFLRFVAADVGRKITQINLQDLTLDRVLRFLHYLEEQRANHIRTRNHRLAIIRTFFEFIADRVPEMIAVAHRIGSIPSKRVPPPESRYLERREIKRLLAALPSRGQYADRDRTLLLFLYNTGARAQEAADLRVGHVEFEPQPRVRLHGKGDKWRLCPLWAETALQIRHLPAVQGSEHRPDAPVFLSQRGRALTRFGIYKIVRRHTDGSNWTNNDNRRHITPHVLRHTTAVHLLEAGVEINVIRGWLGHVRLETTNRYAEITLRGKEAALRACEPPLGKGACRKPVWRNDDALLSWLDSL